MLVLTRQREEVICIGDDVRVVLVDIRGDKVRLGVEAPRDVIVDREEIVDAATVESVLAELRCVRAGGKPSYTLEGNAKWYGGRDR